jgi:hypothetical protein
VWYPPPARNGIELELELEEVDASAISSAASKPIAVLDDIAGNRVEEAFILG